MKPPDDPLFRPLSAKVMPARARFTIGGKLMSEKTALAAARNTRRLGFKGPKAGKASRK